MSDEKLFRHRIRVRYGEVDREGVVFNAHYLAYIDDAMENWLEPIAAERKRERWDMMLKRLGIEEPRSDPLDHAQAEFVGAVQ